MTTVVPAVVQALVDLAVQALGVNLAARVQALVVVQARTIRRTTMDHHRLHRHRLHRLHRRHRHHRVVGMVMIMMNGMTATRCSTKPSALQHPHATWTKQPNAPRH